VEAGKAVSMLERILPSGYFVDDPLSQRSAEMLLRLEAKKSAVAKRKQTKLVMEQADAPRPNVHVHGMAVGAKVEARWMGQEEWVSEPTYTYTNIF
jgi:hypothetical protein